MSVKRIVGAVLAAGFLLCSPGYAQIASFTDTSGRRVYVNDDSPKRGSGSTMSSTPAHPAAQAAPKAPPSPSASAASPDDSMEKAVQDSAARHSVDPALVRAVINTESGWNPGAISRKGAVGLMQLVPRTAERFGVGNPYDPAQNIEGGTKYLRTLLDRYDNDLNKTLAAYNAGEGAVDRSNGVPWYPETRKYVRKVTDAYFRPDSGRSPTLAGSGKNRVRKEVDQNGRVIFTNE